MSSEHLMETFSQEGEKKDHLAHLMELQLELQEYYYGRHPSELPNQERIQYIQDMVTAAQCELVEVLDEVGWKPWASKKFINVDLGQGEVVDLLHFVFSLALAFGMTPELLYEKYLQKQAVNRERAMSNYTGVDEKCFSCGRDLGDLRRAGGCPRGDDCSMLKALL